MLWVSLEREFYNLRENVLLPGNTGGHSKVPMILCQTWPQQKPYSLMFFIILLTIVGWGCVVVWIGMAPTDSGV